MKWLVVLGIVVYVLYTLRKALVGHPIFGSAFRVLLGPDGPARPLTSRDWFKGTALLGAFGGVGVLCNLGLTRASDRTSWSLLDSPYLQSLAETALWVGGLALIGAAFSLVAACVLTARTWFTSRRKSGR